MMSEQTGFRSPDLRGLRVRMGASVVLLALVAGCLSSRPEAASPGAGDPPGAEAADGGAGLVDYRLQPGDVLAVRVYARSGTTPVYQDGALVVDPRGEVTMPVAGRLRVDALTLDDCRAALLNAFSAEYASPVVSVNFAQRGGAKIHILGEVVNPGSYALTARTTSLEAVLMAGGFSQDADTRNVVIVRPGDAKEQGDGEPGRVTLDFAGLIEKAERLPIVDMRPGDIVYVPPAGMARTARFHNHLTSVLTPYATVLRAVGDVILWDQITGE